MSTPLTRTISAQIDADLRRLWCPGQVVLHDWVEWIREHAPGFADDNKMNSDGAICNASVATDDDDHVDVVHGPVHVERRSRFIAHAARVTTRSQVDWVVRSLRYDSKLQTATHNIVAYRLRLHDGSLLENRDDDGEGGAGDCLLYLLQRMDLVNVVGVVSRWFGGVKLGPDRFRIISNVLKELIDSTEWRHGR